MRRLRKGYKMVDNLFRDITGIAMAIIGVAILYTLVNPRNNTSQVIQASAGGFATALGAAMGASTNGGTLMGY